jgi:hypothetical protein
MSSLVLEAMPENASHGLGAQAVNFRYSEGIVNSAETNAASFTRTFDRLFSTRLMFGFGGPKISHRLHNVKREYRDCFPPRRFPRVFAAETRAKLILD